MSQASWSKKTKQTLHKVHSQNFMYALTMVVLFAILCVICTLAIQSSSHASAEEAQLRNKISAAEIDIDRLSHTKEVTPVDVHELLTKAQQGADSVVSAQNSYVALSTNNQGNAQAIAAQMDTVLAESARTWRTPWYSGKATWSAHVSPSASHNVDVLWLATNDAGQIMAYAHGVFNTDDGVFESISVTQTMMGAKAIEATDEGKEERMKEMVKRVQEAVPQNIPNSDPHDLKELGENRSKLQDYLAEKGK